MKAFITVIALLAVASGGFVVYQQKNLEVLEQEASTIWPQIKLAPTVAKLDSFLVVYEKTTAGPPAKMLRDSLKLEEDWQAATKEHTSAALQAFVDNHPASRYEDECQKLMVKIAVEEEWQVLATSNSVADLQAFADKQKGTPYAAKANARIIDLEVDKIFAGKHGVLPPAQRVAGGGTGSNTLEIENGTDYTLTVQFSGVRSQKLVLKPRAEGSIALPSGHYRVAASVNAANVVPFAGEQSLEGGQYTSMFYISGLAGK